MDKFDYKKGYRFSTYATCWIKQYIFQAFADHDRLIRLPGHAMDSLTKYRRAITHLQAKLGQVPTDLEVAQYLNMSTKKIAVLRRMAQRMLSLEGEMVQKDGNSQTLAEVLEDESTLGSEEQLCRRPSKVNRTSGYF